MRLLRRRQPHPEISLVSTADVSFLLLIFFLSTAVFSVERGIVLELPMAGDAPVELRRDRVVEVAIGASRQLTLDGATVRPADLRAAIQARLRTTPDLVVRLSVDPAAPYAALVEALDQIKLSGARSLTLHTGAGT
jgi:biopolymer transport protein ExbD